MPERVDIRGVAVDLLVGGSGRPLLYLHAGDGVDPSDPFLPLLARHFKVFAPSHPGFGGSDLPRRFGTVDDLAYFYLDFIETLDLRDIVLVGSSFGGWLAAELAIRGTGRFSHLVLADTWGAKFGTREGTGITDIFSTPLTDLPGLLFADPAKGAKAFGNLDFANMTEDAVTRFARNREALTLLAWSPPFHNPRLANWLHRIDIPTLVLWGAEDKVAPVGYGRAFAGAIPGARFETIPDAGHYLAMEQPEKFTDVISAFARDAVQQRGAA